MIVVIHIQGITVRQNIAHMFIGPIANMWAVQLCLIQHPLHTLGSCFSSTKQRPLWRLTAMSAGLAAAIPVCLPASLPLAAPLDFSAGATQSIPSSGALCWQGHTSSLVLLHCSLCIDSHARRLCLSDPAPCVGVLETAPLSGSVHPSPLLWQVVGFVR